ncbi:beta-1,4-glucuronyltransferase 1-like [Venturia canescens]|uniref:beta-1,4-glucuronyltransferase 1-like n=1 Tax=Venturia canescens TaxID=32260 RepID=UPI001C9BFCEE|nr:beta-1,4-glucuronyltransferase 1-like [Venturia canescens]
MRMNLRRFVIGLLAFLVIFWLFGKNKLLLLAGDDGGGGGGGGGGDDGEKRIIDEQPVETSVGYENIAVIEQEKRNNLRGSGRAYAPGAYMAGRRPGNHSFCKWYHGLPINLEYRAEKIVSSPQARRRGGASYRVLPYATRGWGWGWGYNSIYSEQQDERFHLARDLALCTHATADQVYHVVELATRWEGPISLAVFAPGFDAGLAVTLLERACRCEPQMAKVTVHLVFPVGRPPVLSPLVRRVSFGDCAASDLQFKKSDTERKKRGMRYPINVARNVARSLSPGKRVLVSDIELLPSERLASGFLRMINTRRLPVPTDRTDLVFVVPIFEIDARERAPRNKTQLVAAVRNGLAVYFHRFVCIHCQRFPGITRWMLRPDPGRVKPLILTRREYPYHRWEPVFIGTKDDPMYNEDMSWEGRQDKMLQMLEMCLMNYRLIILDGAFLVHTPGIKYKPSSPSSRMDMSNESHPAAPASLEEIRNARIYHNFTRRLLQKYPINRKCGQ